MPVTADQEVAYYTEARIRYWLKNWPLLESLAETPATSTHHLGHGDLDHGERAGLGSDRQQPCERAPGVGRNKGSHGDPLRYVDVLADLRRAHASLRYMSLEWLVVDYQQRFGPLGMRTLRDMVKRDMNAVTDAYRRAVEQMARYLSGG